MVPVIPASLAGPRRARRRLSLVVASFDPDRVSRRHAIGVMCADSLFDPSDTAVGDDRIHEAVATVADEVGFAEAKAA